MAVLIVDKAAADKNEMHADILQVKAKEVAIVMVVEAPLAPFVKAAVLKMNAVFTVAKEIPAATVNGTIKAGMKAAIMGAKAAHPLVIVAKAIKAHTKIKATMVVPVASLQSMIGNGMIKADLKAKM